MTLLRNLLAAGLAAGVLCGATGASAQSNNVERRIDQLEQELKLLRQQVESKVDQANVKADKALAKVDEGAKVTMKGPAPVFESADGRFKLALTGRIHYDAALFDADQGSIVPSTVTDVTDLNSGTNFRRARLGLKGTIDRDWHYRLSFDGGGASSAGGVRLDSAYLSYAGLKPITLTAGKHKTPNGFEELTGSNDITFIERSIAENTPLGAFAEKKVGVSARAHGKSWYAGTGVFFGKEADNGDDESVSLHGRMAYAPINSDEATLHFGASGALLLEPLQDGRTDVAFRGRPEIGVDGTQFIAAASQSNFAQDEAWLWGVEAAAKWRGAWIQSEYYDFGFDQLRDPLDQVAVSTDGPDVSFNGYYVAAGYFLTGERKPYSTKNAAWSRISVADPLSLPGGGLGAWEIAGRYSFVDLNDHEFSFDPVTGAFNGVRGGAEHNWTVALNWYVNNWIMFKLNYINVQVDGFTGTGAGLAEQEVADFDVYAMRMQVRW